MVNIFSKNKNGYTVTKYDLLKHDVILSVWRCPLASLPDAKRLPPEKLLPSCHVAQGVHFC